MTSDDRVTDSDATQIPPAAPGASYEHDEAFDEALIQWYQEHSWADILLHHGWHTTSMKDRCLCPIWTAPGRHASQKSATTHEQGCQLRPDSLDPPMHLWTDNPGDELLDYLDAHPTCAGTLSKFQVYTILEHGGDFSKAVRTAGFPVNHKSNGMHLPPLGAFSPATFWNLTPDPEDPIIDPDAALTDAEFRQKLLSRDSTHSIPLGTPESGLIWSAADEDPTDLRLENLVFSSHPALEHIRKYSRLRGPSPWGVLLKTIAEALYYLPPHVKLPPSFSESPGELNLVAAFVAPSGRGKGQTMGCSPFEWVTNGVPVKKISRRSASSGEGMLTRYVRWEARPKPEAAPDPNAPANGIAAPVQKPVPKPVQEIHLAEDEDGGSEETPNRLVLFNRRGWFDYPEIDILSAKMSGENSTLSGMTRQLWSGETLGGDTKKETMHVPEGRYRGILTVSAQPSKSGCVYDDEEGGLAQRILATVVQDPYVNRLPAYPHDPAAANKMNRPRLDVTALLAEGFNSAVRLVITSQLIRDEITEGFYKGAWGEAGDPLDSHSLLNRLKLATGIAVIIGLYDAGTGPAAASWYRAGITITDEIWEIAGLLMVHLTRVREALRRGLKYNGVKKARNAGRERGIQEDEKGRTLTRLEVERVEAEVSIITSLRGAPEQHRSVRDLASSALRRRDNFRDRNQVRGLLEGMLTRGYIMIVEGVLGGKQEETIIGLGTTAHPRVPGTGAA